jgi:hypothetical protein
LSKTRQFFRQIFQRKNHNIGPRKFSPPVFFGTKVSFLFLKFGSASEEVSDVNCRADKSFFRQQWRTRDFHFDQ